MIQNTFLFHWPTPHQNKKTQAVFEQLVFESADMPALPSPGFYNFPVRTGTSGAEGLGEYDSGTESLYSNKILLLLLLTVSQVCANTHFGYKVTNL
ncbi:hypothetical protein [Pseudoflavonifractor phocaeensis]|uniref:hypothetical protein n=1 Tax=Flintibacter porci TaxID=3342383 RepID=UPI001F2A8EE2|nr:hypothetical protein [Pseudoflavonifractor phocaeensis]MCF2677204.1 hypothetical protein [Pseudoflavonifractor phocaeensis]